MGCEEPSPCPDLGNECIADQSQYRTRDVSLACECALADHVLGAEVDLSVTDKIWADQVSENLGGSVVCTTEDAWYNEPSRSTPTGKFRYHVRLPPNACCGEWSKKLADSFADHLINAGPMPCWATLTTYPWELYAYPQ